jgi:hypothetical protein
VTGLKARQDVDPEMAVALGAAIHAGVINVGSAGMKCYSYSVTEFFTALIEISCKMKHMCNIFSGHVKWG